MTTEQQLLSDAANEITWLRAENKSMASRLDMFDKMMSLFHAAPDHGNKGMSEDLVWKIQRHLDTQNTTQS